MAGERVGLLHPGAMGSSVGAAARAAGARVCWASEGRSSATRERARAEGLGDAGTLAELVARSEILLSVCPPAAALEVAERVAALQFTGIYLDANAVAPGTARAISARVLRGGARFVDGGIIGPPARRVGTTRLYLSGESAAGVASLFEGSALEAIPIEGGPGAASALKVAYAAWTKGSAALLTAIRALASREGIEAPLLAEWTRSVPDLPGRSEASARATAAKAWRFVAEMEEIAASFEAAGLPGGFHRAAAEVYGRLAGYKDAGAPDLAALIETLLESESPEP
jgi:3-hydroxyisobutyrate dehydrogenase-like beta-hydroxyacid dehydrogenase